VRYLITGGAGFIGSHLAEVLLAEDHDVIVLDDLSTGSLANLDKVSEHPKLKFVQGSVARQEDVEGVVEEADTVFHLAASVGVELVVKDPVHTIETNVHGAENIFACAGQSNKRVIMASTSEVYGRTDRELFGESDDLIIGPPTHYRWSYAASKALDEFLALAYYKEHRLRPVIVRLFNTVGPRQTGKYGMVIPRLVSQALNGEPITVYGDGNQSRCFCHVQDTVKGLLSLERHESTEGEIFNLGSRESVTINQLAQLIKEISGSSSEIVHVPYDEAYEPGFEDMHHRAPDIGKICALTGWSPEIKLRRIISDIFADRN